jgi:hypothetical protein
MVGVWQGIKGLTDLGGLIKHKYMCTCVNDSSFIEFIYNVLDSFIHVFVRLLLLFIDMYYTSTYPEAITYMYL